MKLWLDIETYNEVPISYGTYVYAETAQVELFGYAIDDEEPTCVDITELDSYHDLPERLCYALKHADEIWAHSSFDRIVLAKQMPWHNRPIENWRDSMVMAMENALPAGLGNLCKVLGLDEDQAKLAEGHELVKFFCKPRPKNHKLHRATRHTHPEKWALYKMYGARDVSSMRECVRRMPRINYPDGPELEHWILDQKINDRGFKVDMELVDAALKAVRNESLDLRRQVIKTTNGELTSTTKRDQTLLYILKAHGIDLPDLTKATVTRLLEDPELDPGLRELLTIRQQASATSTSKFSRLRQATNSDGRCRGTIQFCGAKRTGRAAGRIFQPQNLPSRGLLEEDEIEFGIRALKNGVADMFTSNLMHLLTSVIRGCVISDKSNRLVVSDLSNIEGRVAAWVAEEAWKLQAFRDFDAGIGPDLYNLAYARSFNVPVESVDKKQRSIGKVQELMLGYGGGVGAFVTGALGYGFDLEDLAKNIWDTLPEDKIREARKFLEWARKKNMPTYDLSDEAFITCDVLKRLWREANSNISGYWKRIEDAVVAAIHNPGQVYQCGPYILVKKTGAWLRIRLPSGRVLPYPSAQVIDGTIKFFGEAPFSRKWKRLTTWGGTLFENICQAIARDVLYDCKKHAKRKGYKIILHVHDELVTEAPDSDEYNDKELSRILAAGHSWTNGLPLAAAGFIGYRFKK